MMRPVWDSYNLPSQTNTSDILEICTVTIHSLSKSIELITAHSMVVHCGLSYPALAKVLDMSL